MIRHLRPQSPTRRAIKENDGSGEGIGSGRDSGLAYSVGNRERLAVQRRLDPCDGAFGVICPKPCGHGTLAVVRVLDSRPRQESRGTTGIAFDRDEVVRLHV